MSAPAAETSLRLFARHDLVLERANGHVEITGMRTNLRVGPLSSAASAAVQLLFSSPASESELAAGVVDAEGPSALPGFLLLLHHLDAAGVLGRLVTERARPLASLLPLVDGYRFAPSPAAGGRTYRLSRFALLRRQGADLVLESPLAPALIVVHAPEVALLVHALARPRTREHLGEEVGGVVPDTLCRLLELLSGAGLMEHGGEEDPATALGQWEFHDLLFHSRSRLGRRRDPYGGTNRFRGVVDPPVVVKAPMTGDLETLPQRDPDSPPSSPLGDVLKRRRSVRSHAPAPLTRAQLGEFLHRAARSRGTVATPYGELTSRPYPSGGALYELEIYAAVDRCEGLGCGLYQYLPEEHGLVRLCGPTPGVERLIEDAYLSIDRVSRPQVLLVLAARFQRVSWKYSSMAYALVLKDVGVMMQTMYLVATDMGLAPCALGGGNADLFAAAAGLDYLEEGSVGEFVLGTPDGEPLGVGPSVEVPAP
ncbi:MAG: oxazoline/thiazoline dehydrogenase [Actinomycetota bacterium]|jgi:SagB-type dehydrogenase family enzyme|nr:oxazoline/thiazoline dehydrogenase [Actinomycetota bacterium]